MSQRISHSSYNDEIYEDPKKFSKIVKRVTAKESLAGATPVAIVLYAGSKRYGKIWQTQMDREGQRERGELHPETPIYRV